MKRKFATVVMDGSNKDVLNEIIGIHGSYVYPNDNKISCRPMSKDHPTMMVIKLKCTKKVYDSITAAVEKKFPGLCVFNAKI